jgi:sugar lactone lactonase YvrE
MTLPFAGRAHRVRWLTPLFLFTRVALFAVPARAQIAVGDVMVSQPNKVLQYSPAGQLKRTIDINHAGSEVTGSAFDRNGNFFVTAFQARDVVRFDADLARAGSFGSPYEHNPESILFDSKGSAYVGSSHPSFGVLPGLIKKLSPDGTELETFHVKAQNRGADWIDLASDERTMFYTSEGSTIFRYDIENKAQLPDFSHGGDELFAFRILPDGGVLAANSGHVLRLDSLGQTVRTYLDGSKRLFALNLDPDGASFWTAEANSGDVFRVEIASGKLITKFNTGAPVGGLSVYGERTAAKINLPTPTPEPPATPPPPVPPPAGHFTFGAPAPCIFGRIPNNSSRETTLDLSTGHASGSTDIEISSGFHVRRAKLEIYDGTAWREVTGNPIHLRVDENAVLRWPVRLRAEDCSGTIPASDPPRIDVRAHGADGVMHELHVPVRAEIQPAPWLHCAWPFLAALGAVLVGLFIFYGVWLPSRFESRLGVMLGQDEDLDGNGFFFPIRARPESRAGFYRDAQIYLTQDFRITRSARNALAHLRADKKRVHMRPIAALWRKSVDGEWEQVPPNEAVIRTGVLHRNDSRSIYFELRVR